jgi:hypothetical protein
MQQASIHDTKIAQHYPSRKGKICGYAEYHSEIINGFTQQQPAIYQVLTPEAKFLSACILRTWV